MNRSWALACLLLALLTINADVVANSNNPEEFGLNFSNEAEAAVHAGVSLSFTSNYAVLKRWGWFTRETRPHSHRYTLMRHALSNRYIVKIDEAETPHIFRSVDEALNFISTQARNRLESYSSNEFTYLVRLSLNKFELPVPLRLKAFVADDWDIDTGWFQWASVN